MRFDTNAKTINWKNKKCCTSTRWGGAELRPCENQGATTFYHVLQKTAQDHLWMHQALLSAKPKLGCSCHLKQGFSSVGREYIVPYFLWCLFFGHFLSISGLSSYFSCLVFYISFLGPWTSPYLIRHNGLLLLNVLTLGKFILNLTSQVNQDIF